KNEINPISLLFLFGVWFNGVTPERSQKKERKPYCIQNSKGIECNTEKNWIKPERSLFKGAL
ncbi:MAG: hypothetical protein QXV88_05335, partial [Candidatus Bathyarchaeia archaeon]